MPADTPSPQREVLTPVPVPVAPGLVAPVGIGTVADDPSGPIEETFPLAALLDTVLPPGADGWRVELSGRWCHVRRPADQMRAQGWKLHLSATPLSAPLVLVAAARVLVRRRCPFKFASTLATVRGLTDARADRGSGGKFITAYPVDDERFRELAEELHEATAGLPGPGILSDRRYRPDGPVHYRFGVFTGVGVLTNDGTYASRLIAPDGSLVPDERRAWFSPPSWVSNPFPATGPTPQAPSRPSAVLLNDRFEVRRAIQHANKGGVYRALDRRTGADVVVKQARPHTQASVSGTDGRDLLRHEARMLARLAPLGITPRLVDLFEHGGDLFLAEEDLDGVPMRAWTAGRAAERDGGVPVDEAVVLAARLVDLVASLHGAGLVLRDLSPNNLLIVPGPDVRLVDLEFVAEPGTPSLRAYTPGYGAPEVERAARYGPAPPPAADFYALGATVFHLATGTDPVVPTDAGTGVTPPGRVARLTSIIRSHLPALAALEPLIAGLTADEPARRWDLDRAARFLRDPAPARASADLAPARASADLAPARASADPAAARASADPALVDSAVPPPIDTAISDGLEYLRRSVDTTDPHQVARSAAFGALADRCAVQHGAAGLLMTLVRGTVVRSDPAYLDTLRALGEWLRTALAREPRTLPGLYFGRSGVSIALASAADLLGSPELAGEAAELARRVPVRWPNPDVCHGAAGAGLAQLHWWHRTGDEAWLDRVRDCADGLLAGAQRDDRGIWWPVPRGFDSVLAGTSPLGFGHGIAGIATFLLGAGVATGRDDYLGAAAEAGETLVHAALLGDATARWPADRADHAARVGPMTPHWCSGASGIGTFLVRLWSVTADPRLLDLTERAAQTAWRARWSAPPVQCHGTAGDGELLLDLADSTGDGRFRRLAEDFAQAALCRRTRRDGLVVVADETQREVVADHQTGLSGTLTFLIRLRHGGPRGWLADPPRSGQATDQAPAHRGPSRPVPVLVRGPALVQSPAPTAPVAQ